MHVTDRLIVAHVDRPIPGSTGRVSLLRSAMRGPAGQRDIVANHRALISTRPVTRFDRTVRASGL